MTESSTRYPDLPEISADDFFGNTALIDEAPADEALSGDDSLGSLPEISADDFFGNTALSQPEAPRASVAKSPGKQYGAAPLYLNPFTAPMAVATRMMSPAGEEDRGYVSEAMSATQRPGAQMLQGIGQSMQMESRSPLDFQVSDVALVPLYNRLLGWATSKPRKPIGEFLEGYAAGTLEDPMLRPSRDIAEGRAPFAKELTSTIANAVGQVFLQAGMATGAGTAIASMPMALQEAGGSYAEERARHLEAGTWDEEAQHRAADAATTTGVMIGVTEKVGMDILLNKAPWLKAGLNRAATSLNLPDKAQLLFSILSKAGTEGGQELGQEFLGDVISRWQAKNPKAFDQWRKRYALSTLGGAVAGGGVSIAIDLAAAGKPIKEPIAREAVARWAIKHPEEANELAKAETGPDGTPTRAQWQDAELPSAVAPVRKQFLETLRSFDQNLLQELYDDYQKERERLQGRVEEGQVAVEDTAEQGRREETVGPGGVLQEEGKVAAAGDVTETAAQQPPTAPETPPRPPGPPEPLSEPPTTPPAAQTAQVAPEPAVPEKAAGAPVAQAEGAIPAQPAPEPQVTEKVVSKEPVSREQRVQEVMETFLPNVKDRGRARRIAEVAVLLHDITAFGPERFDVAPPGTAIPGESVEGPQRRGGKTYGWTDFTDAAKAIIGGTEHANVSTWIHEFAHPMRKFLFNRDMPQESRGNITDEDIKVMEDFCGAVDGKWDTAANEKFADAWEQFWYEGEAPTPKLNSIFQKIANWMSEVYGAIKQIVGLTPEVRAVFGKVVQRGEAPALPNYGKMTLAELEVEASDRGLKGYRGRDVKRLRKMLREADRGVRLAPLTGRPTGTTAVSDRKALRERLRKARETWSKEAEEEAQPAAAAPAEQAAEPTKGAPPVSEATEGEPTAAEEKPKYADMTVKELTDEIKRRKLKGYGKKSKAQRQAMLEEDDRRKQTAPGKDLTPEGITEAWLKSKGDERGFYTSRETLVRRFRQLAGRLRKKPWSNFENITAKNRQGKKDYSLTGRYLKEMQDIGVVQVAWDREGTPYYALSDETIPDHLMKKDAADEFFAEQERKGEDAQVEPVTRESLQRTLDLTPQQSQAVLALAKSMTLDPSRLLTGRRKDVPPEALQQISQAAARMAETGKRYTTEEEFFAAWDKALRAVKGKRLGLASTKRAVDQATADIAEWLASNEQFQDYYSKDNAAERAAVSQLYPELRNDAEWAFYKIVGAIASNSTNLSENITEQIDAWGNFRDNQQFDVEVGRGVRNLPTLERSAFPLHGGAQAVKAQQYQMLNQVVREQGSVEAAVEWLLDTVPASQIRGLPAQLGVGPLNGKQVKQIKDTVEAATGSSQQIPRMFAFGPKLGAYAMNHLGRSEYTTVDVWESRYWRSFFKDAPVNTGLETDTEARAAFKRAGNAFAETLGLSPSAAQAIRWYYIIQKVNEAGYTKAKSNETISAYTEREVAARLGGTGAPSGRARKAAKQRRGRESSTLRRGRESSTLRGLLGDTIFQQEGPEGVKGFTQFVEDGKAIIWAVENPDVSTALHELAHVARNQLLGDTPRADFTADDIKILHNWAGVVDGIWTRKAEEKFARGFERYIRDGKVPAGLHGKIRGVFKKLANWLASIYESLTGSPIDIDISPEMRAVFDKLVAPGTTEVSSEDEAPGAVGQDRSPLQERGQAGNTASVITADGKTKEVQYVAVEAEDLIPSHDATNAFTRNEGALENERPYHDPKQGAESRAVVLEIAKVDDAEKLTLLTSDVRSPVDGPPIADEFGIVLGGNGRTMGVQLAYHRGGEPAQRLRQAMVEASGKFGLDQQAVAGMKNPVIVRVMPEPIDRNSISALLNESLAASKSQATVAVSQGKRVSVNTATKISQMLEPEGLEDAPTLRDVLGKPAKAERIVQMLRKDGAWSDREIALYVDPTTGALNADGKSAIEQLLVGRLISDPSIVGDASPGVRQKLIAAIGPLVRGMSDKTHGERITQVVKDAVQAFGGYKAENLPLERYFMKQQALFDVPGQGDYAAAGIVHALDKMGSRKFKNAMDGLMRSLGVKSITPTKSLFGEMEETVDTIEEAVQVEINPPLTMPPVSEPTPSGEAAETEGPTTLYQRDDDVRDLAEYGAQLDTSTYDTWCAQLKEDLGGDIPESYLQAAWNMLRPPQAPPQPQTPPRPPVPPRPPAGEPMDEPPVGGPMEWIGIFKDFINAMRDMVDLPILEASTKEELEAWGRSAVEALSRNARAADALVNELSGDARVLDKHEVALLALRYRQLANEIEPLQDAYFEAVEEGDPGKIATARTVMINARKEMTAFEEIIHPAKSEMGRAFRALQMMVHRDFTLGDMLREGQEANGGHPLSKEQEDQVADLYRQIKELRDQLDAVRKKNDDLEAERAYQEQHDQTVKDHGKKGRKGRRSGRPSTAREKSDLDSAWAKFAKAGGVKVFFQAEKSPELDAAETVVQVYRDLGVWSFAELKRHVTERLGDEIAKTKEGVFRQAWNNTKPEMEADDALPAFDKKDMAALAVLTREARRIQRGLVESGLTNREEILTLVHEEMRDRVEGGLTKLETRDALGRYGQFEIPSQEPIEKLLRDLNAQNLKISQIERLKKAIERANELRQQKKTEEEIGNQLIAENLLVEATGLVRDPPSQLVRNLTKEYNKLKKEIPASTEDMAGMLQTTEAAIIRGLKNRIRDLTWDITHPDDRIVRGKREPFTSKEIEALKAERDELQEIHRIKFPPEKTPLTPEQRLANAEKAAERMLEQLQEEELAGFPEAEPKEPLPPSSKLDELRRQLAEIRARRAEAHRAGKRISQLDKQIDELEQKIAKEWAGIDTRRPQKVHPRSELEIAHREAIAMQLREQLRLIRDSKKPKMSDEERARRSYIGSLRSRIEKYQGILARGDFSPPKKKEPRTKTQEELDLLKQLEDLKSQKFKAFAEWELKHMHPVLKAGYWTAEGAHLSRAIMTSFDLSFMLRQGGLPAFGNPLMAARVIRAVFQAMYDTSDINKLGALGGGLTRANLGEFLKTIDSAKAEHHFLHRMMEDEFTQFMVQAGMHITSSDEKITRQEEAFQGRLGKYVPGVAISGRIYTMMANKMRVELAKIMCANMTRNGRPTLDEAKMIASFINIATGRSELMKHLKGIPILGKAAELETQAHWLNTVFFAPRYVASRFQYLALPFYLPFQGGGLSKNWAAKRAIYQEYGKTAVGIGTFLGVLQLIGMLFFDDDDEDRPRVEFNPVSSDFLKVRIGETRIDPMAGLSQAFVFSSKFAAGRSKSTITGKTREFGEGYKPMTRSELTLRFMRSKLAPVPGFLWTAGDDWKNAVGKKQDKLLGYDVHPSIGAFANIFSPLSVHDVVDTMEQQGLPLGSALSLLAILGMGMNTYGPRTDYMRGNDKERREQLDKHLKRMTWQGERPAYEELLTASEIAEVDKRHEQAKRNVVGRATRRIPKRRAYESDEAYMKALESYQRAQDTFAEMKAGGVPIEQAQAMLRQWYTDKYGTIYDESTKYPFGYKPAYYARVRRLHRIYRKQA